MRAGITSVRLALALAAAGALAACGQRGALYLPEESSNVVVSPAPSAAPAAGPVATDPAAATPDSTEEQRRNTTSPAK